MKVTVAIITMITKIKITVTVTEKKNNSNSNNNKDSNAATQGSIKTETISNRKH